ncbi:hypothetical protein C923_04322 [Plasmodium falciparum UGT5.1]|uniref:Surface antigen n=1 Tax=Plasmodium falciparum UGT5.1 TaxID=1237627 RepID=W7JTY2_PLAFA|nr:hypothetical protein C923_04322 [Plasmodium falciparum UGT5.1]
MKLHFPKILLFFFPSNILLTSYHVYNKNKIYITPHHTQTNRSLCECDTQSSSYDKDEEMKCVMQQFDDRTSQRLRKYDERLQDKRQKRKEQRDKDIQEIILKDKVEKSLSEKVEKGCLKCGCGLGSVAASVGIIGPIVINELKKAATAAAVQKGIEVGMAKAIDELGKIYYLSDFSHLVWAAEINGTNFLNPNSLHTIVNKVYLMCEDIPAAKETHFCSAMESLGEEPNVNPVKVISQEAAKAAAAADKAAKTTEANEIALANSDSTYLYSAIGYSVLAILIIVLVLIIIYLVLRYRRKKKMNKYK